MRRVHWLLAAVWAVLHLAACTASVGADGRGASEEQLVYRPLLTDRFEYRRVHYPQHVGTILVLADTPVVIEATMTEVYFWPITREYLADFEQRDEPVEGRLEVVDGSGQVRSVVPRPYSLWYPNGVAAGESELLIDDEAVARHEQYVREARAAAEASIEYQRRLAEHEAELQEWLQMQATGVEPLPPPPGEFTEEPPEQFRGFASEPAEAPVVSMPQGEYTIRLRREDGAIVPGSERRVVSFGPRRQGVGYVIVPERRWTQPSVNFDPDEAIYVTGVSDLYLQPVGVEEYSAARYARLLDPQTIEAPDEAQFVWIPRDPLTGAELLTSADGGSTDRVGQRGYRVVQHAGATRGYTIEPFESGDGALEPDFEGMHVPMSEPPVTTLALVDGDEVVAGSQRAVRTMPQAPEWVLYAPAVLPVMLAAALRLTPRRRG
jgi:hypothetical protein